MCDSDRVPIVNRQYSLRGWTDFTLTLWDTGKDKGSILYVRNFILLVCFPYPNRQYSLRGWIWIRGISRFKGTGYGYGKNKGTNLYPMNVICYTFYTFFFVILSLLLLTCFTTNYKKIIIQAKFAIVNRQYSLRGWIW